MNSEAPSSKPDLYVVARIIQSLKKKNKINKTALATTTELSYDKLVKYLDWMSKKGCVIVDANGSVALTREGSEVYEELVQWILKHVGQLKFPRLRATT
jgi:predicted transcriptional regulator